MNDQFLIMILIVVALFFVSPYVITWRIKRLGSAVTDEGPSSEPLFSSWVTIKGTGTFTRQSILCTLKLYKDRIGLHFLWGSEKFIQLSAIREVERLLRGPRTTALKFIPSDGEMLETIMVSGVVDIPKFLDLLKVNSNIGCREVEDSRSMLSIIR